MADTREFVLPDQPPDIVTHILLEGQKRWLQPTEIYYILSKYKNFRIAPEPPNMPQSGSMFLFDRKELRYFGNDGHNWRKEKDGKTVEEAHEILKGRIHCRTSLVHKHIITDATCAICGRTEETVDHIFSECDFVQSFWNDIGWAPAHIAKVQELWTTLPPPHVAKQVLHPLLLLICWEVWKHRNEVVFRNQNPDIRRLKTACRNSVRDWSYRIPPKKQALLEAWRLSFPMVAALMYSIATMPMERRMKTFKGEHIVCWKRISLILFLYIT